MKLQEISQNQDGDGFGVSLLKKLQHSKNLIKHKVKTKKRDNH